jgi:hypothetical protein
MTLSIIFAIIGALASGSTSIRLGNGTLTATLESKPVHFTLAALLKGVELAAIGQTGSAQVGDIQISYTPNAPL